MDNVPTGKIEQSLGAPRTLLVMMQHDCARYPNWSVWPISRSLREVFPDDYDSGLDIRDASLTGLCVVMSGVEGHANGEISVYAATLPQENYD